MEKRVHNGLAFLMPQISNHFKYVLISQCCSGLCVNERSFGVYEMYVLQHVDYKTMLFLLPLHCKE